MVRQRPAKPLFPGSNPGAASISFIAFPLHSGWNLSCCRIPLSMHRGIERVRSGRAWYACRLLATHFFPQTQREALSQERSFTALRVSVCSGSTAIARPAHVAVTSTVTQRIGSGIRLTPTLEMQAGELFSIGWRLIRRITAGLFSIPATGVQQHA